ncbi:MAG TPA: ABC transporter permease [Anaerolineales bacterium]|nr:ABC transporter permease [Anaerolineales bacterium]HMX73418.1 ABC transporter permease [Anaerolineales bacterium]HNC88054.1 ABC transporter permease [Anaerolineales bacterium]HNE68307.1 ABC transporter permease [Anaerolineales bacterium]HNF33608.1 ABC transporter permease [Anaerolineales bacterium]
MKAFDIALKDMTRSFRSTFAVVFMFGVPLLVTGMFYFMFGNIADEGGFTLPKTNVIIANLDEGGPKFQVNPKNIPGGKEADSMGDLIVSILQSDDMADLIEVSLAPNAESARSAVDRQESQVAIIIPADFSHQFADVDGKAVIEFYQDPTLTLGPAVMRSILNRFMDGMSGVKIAINFFMDEAQPEQLVLTGQVVDQYLEVSLAESDDPEAELLEVRNPANGPEKEADESQNLLLGIIGPIMGGMMVFYAYYTGTSTAQSILREEEERTLPRLFTTPTSQATILTGKLLSVFMTVSVQIIVLLIAANLIFGIQWGEFTSVALMAVGIIVSASSFGIFVNSFLKDTKQGGVLFGGILTVTGMMGMIKIFAMNSAIANKMGDTISLLVPQGWAVRGLMQAMSGESFNSIALTVLVSFLWGAAFFAIGVWRFNKRYA